jgi:hypothetical protein
MSALLSACAGCCSWFDCWPLIIASAWLGSSVACLAIALVQSGSERHHARNFKSKVGLEPDRDRARAGSQDQKIDDDEITRKGDGS